MKVNRLRPECILCTIDKQITNYPKDITDEAKVRYMQKVTSIIAEIPATTAVPVIVRNIENLRKEMFGVKEDYSEIKRHFNRLLLEQINAFREQIEAAQDPIMLAMQLALIGNYIDFAVFTDVNEEVLKKLLEQARSKILDGRTYEKLTADLARGNKLVYITDNCGEIVLDRLLIEELKKKYPALSVSVIVRGQQAMNDATIEDAKQVGLTEIAAVVGNGNNIMGTWIPETSEEALELMKDADVLIAKGQANFETLNHCELNVYYLFLCKCDVFSGLFNVPKLHGILVNEFDLNCQTNIKMRNSERNS